MIIVILVMNIIIHPHLTTNLHAKIIFIVIIITMVRIIYDVSFIVIVALHLTPVSK